MKTIGIDIGTTSICGILLDTANGVIKKIEKPNDTWIKTEKEWEKIQDPEKILSTAFSILNELHQDDVHCIGVTGQMHGIVYLDSEGNSISPLYTWQDRRGEQNFNGTTYAKYLNSFVGYGYVTHFYNKENSLVPENAVCFCTIHDYVAMKFAGRTSPIVHSSDAASFGMYDLETNRFTVEDKLLPKITTEFKLLGEFKNAKVSVAIGDNQASFMGSVCGEKSVLVNAGTGSQISVSADKLSNALGIETRPYVEGKYLLVGCSLCGGKSFAVLEQFLRSVAELVTGEKQGKVYDQMLSAIEGKTTGSLTVDTRFMGTRVNPEIKGSVQNITPENFTPAELIFGAIEGMTTELYDMFETLNVPFENLVGSGNGIRKTPAFAQSLSRRFGKTLRIPAHKEEACFGCAIFSLVACGVYEKVSDAQKIIKYEV